MLSSFVNLLLVQTAKPLPSEQDKRPAAGPSDHALVRNKLKQSPQYPPNNNTSLFLREI
jgi:hypothetical protein